MTSPETQTNTLAPSQWPDIIQEWQRSALSGAEFCLQRNLVYHQFQYWKQKLNKTKAPSTPQKPSAFVQTQEGITITYRAALSFSV